jgi:hypothetical protein
MIKVKCLCKEEVLSQFLLDFWTEKISIRNDSNVARIGGEHYMIGTTELKGFGGKIFKIEFFDGRIVITDNLWNQGTIPESYRMVLQDNAKFI